MFYAVIMTLVIGIVSTPALGLTMEEAVAEGLARNPEMQAFRLEEEAARGQVAKAKLPAFSNPVIDGSYSTQSRPSGEAGGAFRNSQVSLSQSVEIAGQRRLRMEAAAGNLERSRFDIQDFERVLRADIRDAFARALYHRDRESLAKEYVHLQEELSGLVSAKFEAGDVAALEVNLSQVELARAKRELIAATTEYRSSIIALARLIGMPPGASPKAEGELAGSLPPLPEKATLLARITERPDLKAAEAETRRSHAAEKLARRDAIPSMTWSLFTGRTEGANETGGTLGMSIPLFDRKRGERMEAKAKLSQARIREGGVTRTAQKEIEESYAAAESSLKELDLFKTAILGRTIENLDLLQIAFREGKISFYDVRVAQRETIDTRSAYQQVLLSAEHAYNALERAIGGGLR